MDKNAIKTFAVESRRKMIKSVKFQASLLGITADGIAEPISKAEGMETYDYGAGQHTIYDEDIKKRESLVREINNKGFENVVEEVAYTWFNRIIAIRYMEVNEYLPTYTRVLSSEIEGKIEPDIITEALDLDLDYSDDDREKILKFKMDNDNDKLFQFLFIKQCNKLNEILPGLFEKTDDYMELLLDIKFTDEDSVVRQLVDTISEEDFGEQVEIIGWMYQYYISEKKDEVININKSNIKKEDIPAATQLFTTDWVVKYMVDNSLGKYWIERKPESCLIDYLQYYIEEVDQDEQVMNKLEFIRSEDCLIEELTFFDPCMGSGHILVYAFDVFFEIYKELGFLERDIPSLILKNNLYGLDIDNRAFQLAYFAILMKAREYDRNIFKKNIVPNVFAIQESKPISSEVLDFIELNDSSIIEDIIYLKDVFRYGKEFGSLIQVKSIDIERLTKSLEIIMENSKSSILGMSISNIIKKDLFNLINQAKLLSNKYSIVVTNPPYMNKFEKNLKDFSKKYYKDYSKDLFSMFMYRNFGFCKENGYCGFLTPFNWMFIKNFEKLRKYLVENKTLCSLIRLEFNAFAEIAMVTVCPFIILNTSKALDYRGVYFNLSEFRGGMEVQNQKVKEALPVDTNYKFFVNQKTFKNTPNNQIIFWEDENLINSFIKFPPLSNFAKPSRGLATYNDDIFLRYWFETSYEKIGFNCDSIIESINSKKTWFPYNKGGSYRKWYGNNYYVVNFFNNGQYIKETGKGAFSNSDYYFSKGLTWSRISSKYFGVRYHDNGFIIGDAGPSVISNDEDNILYLLGILLSQFTLRVISALNSSMTFQVGDLNRIPISFDEKYRDSINKLVEDNISISKEDWDENEISWDFKKHFSLISNGQNIEDSFKEYEIHKDLQINSIKSNENKLNSLINEIYNVKEFDEISDEHVTLIKLNKESFIKSFISYSVGCIFGRYSLDEEGLVCTDNDFNLNNYSKFLPDDDNIIPVLDTEYFNDDIVGRFVEFVKVCFGEETLEENLDFIAGALKKKGKTSREIIRNYFLTDFFKDHAQTYKKTPIYWQFDSGKQNAFKCLIYMHRYEPGLVARVRTDYLHKTQKAIEQNLAQCESIIANSSNKSEVSKATKDKSKYIKQLDEIKVYDEALAHIANQRIEIDLDDGVKVNHAKFQNVEISKEGQKAKKINLLKKI